jgi:hypothetical protein
MLETAVDYLSLVDGLAPPGVEQETEVSFSSASYPLSEVTIQWMNDCLRPFTFSQSISPSRPWVGDA